MGRPESSNLLSCVSSAPIPVAAWALLRLDELAQSHTTLYQRLLRMILAAQEADGGWIDPLVTSLCLRALMAGRGQGIAIERGLAYLKMLQKEDGTWPKLPLRRTAGDSYTSAFILSMLGSDARFQQAVNFRSAVQWFELHGASIESDAKRLWKLGAVKCRTLRFASADDLCRS